MIPDIDLAIATDKPSLARLIAKEVSIMPELAGLRISYPIVWPVGVFLPPDLPADPSAYPTIVPFEVPTSQFRDSLVGLPNGVCLTFWRNPNRCGWPSFGDRVHAASVLWPTRMSIPSVTLPVTFS